MSNIKVADTAAEMTEAVVALKKKLGKQLVSLVLFGSRTRGDADIDSDWDLLLIARNLPDRTLQRHIYLKTMLPDAWRGRVSMLAKTPKEFEARLPALFLDIALDGVVLYDTEEYVTQRLAALRTLLERRGLHREQTQREMVWRWKQSPRILWSLEWEGAL